MLITTGIVALTVYQWVGLDFLAARLDQSRSRVDGGADRYRLVARADVTSRNLVVDNIGLGIFPGFPSYLRSNHHITNGNSWQCYHSNQYLGDRDE